MHRRSLALLAPLLVASAVLSLLTLTVVAPVPAHAWFGPGVNYVNMGDSYSAGSGILPTAPGAPPQCTQSAKNWGHDLAARTGHTLTDVSCGGAQTKDFRSSQFPGVAPQLAALSPSTDLVTLTIGGNDSNVFIGAVTACGTAGATTAGQGNPCQRQYGDTFSRTIRTTTYPAIVATLRDIKAKAPRARVAISGYLQILPPTTGCYPIVPVASGDVPYVNGIEADLNDAVKRAASATGVTFLDESRSVGHDACQPLGVRWVEPVIGSTNYVPVHPNALGEQAMADRAATVLGLRAAP